MLFKKSPWKVLFGKITGFLVFIILLWFANYMIPYFDNNLYSKIVYFFDDNLAFLIILSVIFLIAELFFVFSFPTNFFAPIFGAIGGVMTAAFIYKTLSFTDSLVNLGYFSFIDRFTYYVYLIVFIAVLVVGYISVFKSLIPESEDEVVVEVQKIPKKEKPSVTWDDIGNEFKMALFNLGKTLRTSFETKPKKKN